MEDGTRRRKSRLEGYHLDGEAGGVVVDFYAMATTIASQGFDKGIHSLFPRVSLTRPAAQIVAAIAAQLTQNIPDLKGDILRKSVQEAMIDAAGLGYGPEELNVKAGLEKFLRKQGTKKLLDLFLCRYVFNSIWIRIQESERAKVGGRALSKSMMTIERQCVAAVRSVLQEWETSGKLNDLGTKKRLGSTLIKAIESRLSE